jgi:hypothetical protein
MQKKVIYTILILMSCVFVYLVGKATFPYLFGKLRGVDKEYIEKMNSIKIGMTEQEVIEILGQPTGIITDSEVKETHGIYGSGNEYGKSIKNKNKVLYYHHGIDYIGHYFIDEKDRVYFVNVGGT